MKKAYSLNPLGLLLFFVALSCYTNLKAQAQVDTSITYKLVGKTIYSYKPNDSLIHFYSLADFNMQDATKSKSTYALDVNAFNEIYSFLLSKNYAKPTSIAGIDDKTNRYYYFTTGFISQSLWTLFWVLLSIVLIWLYLRERRKGKESVLKLEYQKEIQSLLINEREKERTRVAQDLHDGPVQELQRISYTLQQVATEKIPSELQDLQGNVNEVTGEIREICAELRPPALVHFGLEKAVKSYIEKLMANHFIEIELNSKIDENSLNQAQTIGIYRIIQEGLNNVIKHAKSKDAIVNVETKEHALILEIIDHGIGFDVPKDGWLPLARNGHLGLLGLSERVGALGGELLVESSATLGTQLKVKIPILKNNEPY